VRNNNNVAAAVGGGLSGGVVGGYVYAHESYAKGRHSHRQGWSSEYRWRCHQHGIHVAQLHVLFTRRVARQYPSAQMNLGAATAAAGVLQTAD